MGKSALVEYRKSGANLGTLSDTMSDMKSEAKDYSHFTFFENFKKGKIFTEAQIKVRFYPNFTYSKLCTTQNAKLRVLAMYNSEC